MPSRSPDKKRHASRAPSPPRKRRKSSADEQYVRCNSDEDVGSIPMQADVAPPPIDANGMDTDAMDDHSTGSRPSFLYSESVLEAVHNRVLKKIRQRRERAAVRKAIRDGRRPERHDDSRRSKSQPSKEDHSSAEEVGVPGPSCPSRRQRYLERKSRWPNLAAGEEFSSSATNPPGQQNMNDPSPERSSSGNLSLESFLNNLEDTAVFSEGSSGMSSSSRQALPPSSKNSRSPSPSSTRSGLPVSPLDLGPPASGHYGPLDLGNSRISGAVGSYDRVVSSPTNVSGTDIPKRKFSFEAEHQYSFDRSSCPSPSPSFSQATELPGTYPSSVKSIHSALDVPKPRGRIPESVRSSKPAEADSREPSPMSKERPNWRYSKRVLAGAITGELRPKRPEPSSRESDAEGRRSSGSLRAHSSSASSIATNVTLNCTSEIKRQLYEAQDTNINTWNDGVPSSEKTIKALSDGGKPGYLQLEEQPPVLVFSTRTGDVPMQDIDDDQNVDDHDHNHNHTREQVQYRPQDSHGSPSAPAEVALSTDAVPDNSNAVPETSVAGDAAHASNSVLQERLGSSMKYQSSKAEQSENTACASSDAKPAELTAEARAERNRERPRTNSWSAYDVEGLQIYDGVGGESSRPTQDRNTEASAFASSSEANLQGESDFERMREAARGRQGERVERWSSMQVEQYRSQTEGSRARADTTSSYGSVDCCFSSCLRAIGVNSLFSRGSRPSESSQPLTTERLEEHSRQASESPIYVYGSTTDGADSTYEGPHGNESQRKGVQPPTHLDGPSSSATNAAHARDIGQGNIQFQDLAIAEVATQEVSATTTAPAERSDEQATELQHSSSRDQDSSPRLQQASATNAAPAGGSDDGAVGPEHSSTRSQQSSPRLQQPPATDATPTQEYDEEATERRQSLAMNTSPANKSNDHQAELQALIENSQSLAERLSRVRPASYPWKDEDAPKLDRLPRSR
ncbi:MAG: hypothetical protein Q9166_000319 [cf. Caloplaca sp. 2 TL-2023]